MPLLPTRQEATGFNQPLSFDTSVVTDMRRMFIISTRQGASALSDANKGLIRCAWADNSAFISWDYGIGSTWSRLGSCR